MATGIGMDAALEIADRVERFVREEVIPYESDPRRDDHGAPLTRWSWKCARRPARRATTPHAADGRRLNQRETGSCSTRSVRDSPLGMLAVNAGAGRGQHVPAPADAAVELEERFLDAR